MFSVIIDSLMFIKYPYGVSKLLCNILGYHHHVLFGKITWRLGVNNVFRWTHVHEKFCIDLMCLMNHSLEFCSHCETPFTCVTSAQMITRISSGGNNLFIL